MILSIRKHHGDQKTNDNIFVFWRSGDRHKCITQASMPSESNVTLSRAWCVEALPGMAWAGVGLETEAQNLAVNIVVTLFTYTAKCHVLESIRRPQFGRIDPQIEHIFKTPKKEITRKSSASHHPGVVAGPATTASASSMPGATTQRAITTTSPQLDLP